MRRRRSDAALRGPRMKQVGFTGVIKVSVHGVAMGDRIIKVALFHHHLRLHEAGLNPLECRHLVAGSVVANTDEAFFAPTPNIGKPLFMLLTPSKASIRPPTLLA